MFSMDGWGCHEDRCPRLELGSTVEMRSLRTDRTDIDTPLSLVGQTQIGNPNSFVPQSSAFESNKQQRTELL